MDAVSFLYQRKMYFPPVREVLLITYVLISSCWANEVDVNKTCDISKHDDNNLTVNCSRRSFDAIPEWPLEINHIDKEKNTVGVLICIFTWRPREMPTYITEDFPFPCNKIIGRYGRYLSIIFYDDMLPDNFYCTAKHNYINHIIFSKGIISSDGHVLVTLFSNNIVNVTELPPTPGSRIAISFKHNRITDIQKDAFQNLERLVYLDLSKNTISGDVLRTEIFRGPYKNNKYSDIALETLNLGHNEIHSLDRYLFQYTPNLTRLYLNNNPIEILDHVTVLAISSATNLEVMDLSQTDIDNIPLDAFKGLKNLQQLDLSGNKFTSVPESLSIVGNSLKYLSFNDNPIVELNDDSFIGLTNLIELEVAENDYLDEVKRSTFSPLKNLRVLHLCHNRNLRYISHNAFRGLKDKWTLREVYLDDNDLSEISPDLMPWSKLDTLGMTGNSWLCNCDLIDIVSFQGASDKFKNGDIPYCAAPLRLSGEFITNITLSLCPTFDKTFSNKKRFSITNLKPKQVLWSIFGVAIVVCIGTVIGWLFKGVQTIYKKKIRNQPMHYINLNSSSFA